MSVSSHATISTQLNAIFVSLELSRSTWLVTSLALGNGERMSRHSVPGGDIVGLLAWFVQLQAKARDRTNVFDPLVVIKEAGLDGFWIHHCLLKEGVERHVVDAASIATSRRGRRAKGMCDGRSAQRRGRRPSSDRARKTGTRWERIQHVNRIKGLLFAQGITGYEPVKANRRAMLEELRTGDVRPLPEHMKRQIERELDRLEIVMGQIDEVNKARDAAMPTVTRDERAGAHALLLQLWGIGPEFAGVLYNDGFYRHSANQRQVAADAGLAPSPWRSGTIECDQGASKAGNKRLRTTMIQVAWL